MARSSSEIDREFVLPDGQPIHLGESRFMCPEVLFQPSLEELKCPNIVDMICNTIDKCDLDYKPVFYKNLVMSGGSSMFPGRENNCRTYLGRYID